MNESTHTSEPLLAAEEEFQNPEQGSQTAQLPDDKALPPVIREAVEIRMKYAGYIARQQKQVEEFAREEGRLLPNSIDYLSIQGLRVEARQKLSEIRPLSVGQASRISGVSPADIAVLLIWLEQNKPSKE